MKSIFKLIAVAFLLTSYAASAQNYVFKVLANKGSNSYKTNTAEWKPLKTGQTLNAGDELKLSDASYIGLMHKSGKTLEIKSEGTHKINDLATNLKNNNSSVASKYADFVINKMTDSGDESDYRKSLGATGAVTRAIGAGAVIKIMAQSSSAILNDQVVIRWNEPEQEGEKDQLEYVLTFSNLFDEEIKKESTQKTSYLLDMTKEPFASMENKFVKVKVSVEGNDLVSEEYAITTKPKSESAELKATLAQLKGENQDMTALDHIVLAAFYEEHGLLLDALTAYEKAIEMAPKVDIYEKAYADFLQRNEF